MAAPEQAVDAVAQPPVFPPFDNHSFVSQIVWLVVVFGLLYWMMSRVALPRVGSILEARRGRIEGDLADAARMQQQASDASAAYDSKLADAKARSQALAQTTHEAAIIAHLTGKAADPQALDAAMASAKTS